MCKIYSFGYGGKKPEDVVKLVDRTGALLLDVRLSPNSRNPMWNGSSIKNLLGDRYIHARGFGNENYKGGPVKLHDPEMELMCVQGAFTQGVSIILMCVCKSHARCHRKDVAEFIHERTGKEIVIL